MLLGEIEIASSVGVNSERWFLGDGDGMGTVNSSAICSSSRLVVIVR